MKTVQSNLRRPQVGGRILRDGGGAERPIYPPTVVNRRDGSPLRLIPAGKARMGSSLKDIINARDMDKDGMRFAISHEPFALSHETPQFDLFVPAFYIGVFTVTNEQFASFLSETQPDSTQLGLWVYSMPYITKPLRANGLFRAMAGFERHPAIHISWVGAAAYCKWAGLRLPTEVEWEKAARGFDGRTFPWGDEWHDNFLRWRRNGRAGMETCQVDAFPEGRSPYGIYQMAGNVAEWCEDWYEPNIYSQRVMGSRLPPYSGDERVLRGGTCAQWHRLEFRCAMRQASPPVALTLDFTGIRCACDVQAHQQ